MAEEEKKTKAQQEAEAKERRREIALRNLKSQRFMDLGALYMTTTDSSRFGREITDAVGKHYDLSLASQEGASLMLDSLKRTRDDGRYGSGYLMEREIPQRVFTVLMESLSSVKVSDILDAIGSKVKAKSEYADLWFDDFFKKYEDVAKGLLQNYRDYIVRSVAAQSIQGVADETKKNLENLLSQGPKKIEAQKPVMPFTPDEELEEAA